MNLSPDLKARVLAAAKKHPSPTRGGARLRVSALVALALVFAGAVFYWLGGPHLAPRPLAFVCGTILGWSLVAVAAAWLAFWRGGSMVGRRRSWLLGLAASTPAILFAWMLLWNWQYPETLIAIEGRIGLRCLAFTMAIAAWPLIALAYFRRERDPSNPGAAGAARGVAMGALAGVVVDMWCPIANPMHVLLGHVGPMLLLMGIGALAGYSFSGVRASRGGAPRA
jgi:hypothetical protein